MYGLHRELPLGERQGDRSIRITHGAPSLKFLRRRRELPLQSMLLFLRRQLSAEIFSEQEWYSGRISFHLLNKEEKACFFERQNYPLFTYALKRRKTLCLILTVSIKPPTSCGKL